MTEWKETMRKLSELKNRTIEITQFEQLRENKQENKMNKPQGNVVLQKRRANIHAIGIVKGEEKYDATLKSSRKK